MWGNPGQSFWQCFYITGNYPKVRVAIVGKLADLSVINQIAPLGNILGEGIIPFFFCYEKREGLLIDFSDLSKCWKFCAQWWALLALVKAPYCSGVNANWLIVRFNVWVRFMNFRLAIRQCQGLNERKSINSPIHEISPSGFCVQTAAAHVAVWIRCCW